MSWYYIENNNQQGPVDAEGIKQLIASGKINDQTYLWTEGLDSWKFYSEIKGQFATASASEPVVPAVSAAETRSASAESVECANCKQILGRSDCLELSDKRWVCAPCKPIVIQQMKEGVAFAGNYVYAGFWRRFAAKLIDSIILMIVTTPISFGVFALLGVSMTSPEQTTLFIVAQLIQMVVNMAICCAYTTFMVGKYSATVGKKALGLKVIRPDGKPLTFGRACGRYFAEILSGLTLTIGYIMAGFDKEKRSLHDRVADTRVIIAK